MASTAERLRKLEQVAAGLSGGTVLVQPCFGPEGTPGEAVRWPHDRRGLTLYVPVESAGDPMGGLTASQRAMIGPDDRVISVAYTDDWRGEGL